MVGLASVDGRDVSGSVGGVSELGDELLDVGPVGELGVGFGDELGLGVLEPDELGLDELEGELLSGFDEVGRGRSECGRPELGRSEEGRCGVADGAGRGAGGPCFVAVSPDRCAELGDAEVVGRSVGLVPGEVRAVLTRVEDVDAGAGASFPPAACNGLPSMLPATAPS